MEIETVAFCPLDKVCEEAKDGKIYRCMWLIDTAEADENGRTIPNTDRKHCSVPILSIHLSQLKGRTLGVQHAVESARNENIKRQDTLVNLMREENALVSSQ